MRFFNNEMINLVFVTGLLALICGLLGAALIGVGYARRGQKALTGVALGASLGVSIACLLMGALGLAASNVNGNVNSRLISIASLGLGILIIVMLRVFGPRPEEHLGARLSALASLKIPGLPPQPKPATSGSTETAPTSKPPVDIFISYRRDDSPDVTGRIYDTLVEHYGAKSVYKDVDSIPFGVDFRKHLSSVVEKCDVVLVVIGDRWLGMVDATGQRRLEEQADFVRIEVESALQRDIPVVPLLVKGAAMPKDADLPESIKELAFRNAISIRYDPDFHHDMERLIHSLDEDFGQTTS